MKKCCWLYAGERMATYSACLIGKTIPELVDDFNNHMEESDAQDRIYFRQAVLKELEKHGVDISAVEDVADFSKKVKYDAANRALILSK